MDNDFLSNNKIVRIEILENIGEVNYTTKSGEQYQGSLKDILNHKKEINSNFNIKQKCKELTNSFFQRRRLQERINPVIVEVLNDNEKIYQYINCVKNNEKLFFELKHDTRESSLNFIKRRMMNRMAKYEEKLGAEINRYKSLFKKIIDNTKEQYDKVKKAIIEEPLIEGKYYDALDLLDKAKKYHIVYGSMELEDIEKTVSDCAKWYMENGYYDNSTECISSLSGIIQNEARNYYFIKSKQEYEKGNLNNYKSLLQEYALKSCDLDKLRIKNEYLKGNRAKAKELYNKLINRLGIKLNDKEMEISLKNGIVRGVYYLNDSANGKYREVKLIGDEMIQKESEKYHPIFPKKDNKVDIQEAENKEVNHDIRKDNIQISKQVEQPKPIRKITRSEIDEIIKRNDKMSDIEKYQNGGISTILDDLSDYLKLNKDNDIQQYLETILSDFDKAYAVDLVNENIGENGKYNPVIFNSITNIYKNGIKNKEDDILARNPEKYKYYMYILNQTLGNDNNVNKKISNEKKKEIKAVYKQYGEIIDEGYFNEIKKKNLEQTKTLKDRLIADQKYSQAIYELNINTDSNRIRLMTLAEDLKNGVYSKVMGRFTNKKEFDYEFNDRIKEFEDGNEIDFKTIELLGDICYEGITDNFKNTVVEPNKGLAKKLYTKLLSGKDIDSKICNRLLTLYKEDSDTNSIKEIKKIIKNNSFKIEKEKTDNEINTGNVYVCSDLHGQYEIYNDIMNQLKDNDKLYILGDVIDRGPGGINILQDIIKSNGRVELFMGNHEYMMMQSLIQNDKNVEDIWLSSSNDGKVTKDRFDSLSEQEKNNIKNLLLNSLVYKEVEVNNEKLHLVHAKAIQETNKKQETVKDFLETGRKDKLEEAVWTRKGDKKFTNSEVWKEEEIGKENIFTIIGHTPTNGTIEISDNYVDIDCGVSYFSNECLLRLNDGKVLYIDNFSRCQEQTKDESER
jgi:serine/threonine protein phosphatase 1